MPTLFTSIPKCGKNLITALFDALRLQRIESPSVVEASSHIMVRWSIHARRAGRQVQPAFPDDALDDYAVQTRGGLDALIEDIKRMPADAYIHGHLPFHPDLHRAAVEAGVSIVFVYRDPRAMVASQAAYLLDKGIPEDYLPRLSSRDMPGALRLLIRGDGQTLPVAEIFESYRGWLSAEGVLAVRFEDLVGPLGDGPRRPSSRRSRGSPSTSAALDRRSTWRSWRFGSTIRALGPSAEEPSTAGSRTCRPS